MKKTAVITDSNSGLTQAQGEKLGIKIVPMPFYIDGELFFEDISLNQEEFYKKLETDADISTSQPAPGDLIELWDKVLEEYEEIVYIPMSSGLSSSCSTALALSDDYNGKVCVVNNQRISVTQRQAVLDALELVKQGKLTEGHCKALAGIEDADRQYAAALRMIDRGESVRQAESKNRITKNEKKLDPRYKYLYEDIEDRFQGFFGTKVKLDQGKRKGRIIIEYHNNEDLERMLNLIKGE